MTTRLTLALTFSLLHVSLVSHAGSMGSPPDFAGIFFGVGPGYTNENVNVHTAITMFSNFPAVTAHFNEESVKSSLSPVVDLGYFRHVNNDFLIGGKFVYKYIGVRQNALTWSDSFQNGTYQNAVVQTQPVQDLALFINGAYQFNNCLLYAGVGPAVMQVKSDVQGTLLPSGAIAFQYSTLRKSTAIWEGAAQVGFAYMLPYRLTVDVAYNFAASARDALSTLYFYTGSSGSYSTIAPNAQIINQGISVTLNKYFT